MTLTSHSNYRSSEIAGLYYDGRSSRPHNVSVLINGSKISVTGAGIKRSYKLSNTELSEPLGNAKRMLNFSDGSSCELPDSIKLKTLLASTGHKETIVVWLQNRWRTSALAFLCLIALIALAYRYALPVIADAASRSISDNTLTVISSQAMQSLDKNILKPSNLSTEKQTQLRRKMSEIRFASDLNIQPKVEFRTAASGGPNAFALPDGKIVFYDSLVKLADNDEQLIAVYAHEAGHVHHRHGVRMVIQSSLVALALASYFGDVSSIAGALTGWLINAKYSRDFERQADRFAAYTLIHNNLSPTLLGDFMVKLENEHKRQQPNNSNSKLYDYISSHPSTQERAAEMSKIKAEHK